MQKEQYLSAGAQPEIFQGRASFVEIGSLDKHSPKTQQKKSYALPKKCPYSHFIHRKKKKKKKKKFGVILVRFFSHMD